MNSWSALISGGVGTALLIGVVGWRVSLSAMDHQIGQTRQALKRLHVGHQLPPSREVTDYLTTRQRALETRHDATLLMTTDSLAALPGQTVSPLYFQQRVHEVQRLLERVSASRGMNVPLSLGLPKDIPPTEAVPRANLE